MNNQFFCNGLPENEDYEDFISEDEAGISFGYDDEASSMSSFIMDYNESMDSEEDSGYGYDNDGGGWD